MNWQDARSHQRSKMVYKAQHYGCILSTINHQRRMMENSLLNEIWTLQISDYVIWTYQHTGIVSEIHQQSMQSVSRYLCDSLSWWYPDLFKHLERAYPTHQDNVEEDWRCSATTKTEEVWVSCSRNWVFRTLDYHCRYSDEKNENPSNQKSARTEEHQRDSTVYQFDELLSMILKNYL